MLDLIFYSPAIVSFFLIISYVFWHEEYQWPLGRYFRYIFFGGAIGFVVPFIFVMTWTAIHNSPQGPLVIIFYGPFFFAIGELAGFALFVWLVARKRKRIQEEI